jgi:hypothetical protein
MKQPSFSPWVERIKRKNKVYFSILFFLLLQGGLVQAGVNKFSYLNLVYYYKKNIKWGKAL